MVSFVMKHDHQNDGSTLKITLNDLVMASPQLTELMSSINPNSSTQPVIPPKELNALLSNSLVLGTTLSDQRQWLLMN